MKLLLNENIGSSVVAALRDSGLDAAWVAETSAGLTDRAVIERAFQEGRVLVTKDKDFGEFVFKSGLPHRGVVLLRLSDDRSPNTLRTLIAVLKALAGHKSGFFAVASDTALRIRPSL